MASKVSSTFSPAQKKTLFLCEVKRLWQEKSLYIPVFLFLTESNKSVGRTTQQFEFPYSYFSASQNCVTPPACSSYVELSLTLVWTCECWTDDGSLYYVKPDAKSFTGSEQRGVFVEAPRLAAKF